MGKDVQGKDITTAFIGAKKTGKRFTVRQLAWKEEGAMLDLTKISMKVWKNLSITGLVEYVFQTPYTNND